MANNSIKILVIDDLQDNLITLNALIKDAFPEAITLNAQSGKKGLVLAAKENPDVILLDIIMPGMDGYEVCQKLKADKKLCDIPVVFITAIENTKEALVQAINSGGEAFLTKPIDEIELTVQIRAMLKIREANEAKKNEKVRLENLVKERNKELVRELDARKQAEKKLKVSEATVSKKLKAILEPEGDITSLELSDIIDAEMLQSMMDDFYRLTGMLGAVLDVSGKVLVAVGWQDICTKFHRCHPDTLKNCIESDTALTKGVAEGEFKSYRCKNNMWDIVTPIIIGGKHLGNVFMGQYFLEGEEPDIELFRMQAKKYDFDETAYLAALDRVPRFNKETVDKGMQFYSKLAGLISKLSYNSIQQSRMLAEQKQAEQAVKENEAKLKTILKTAINGFWIVNMQGGFVEVNDAYCQMSGYNKDELLTMKVSDVEASESPEDIKKHINKILENGSDRFETKHRRKDGSEYHVKVNIQYKPFEGGQFVCFLKDITERKQAEEALRTNQYYLEKAQELGKIGSWELDLRDNMLRWTDENCRIFGVPPGSVVNYEIFISKIHPDDREYVDREWKAGVAGKPYDIEHRLLIDGVISWVREKADITFDENGVAVSAIGFTQDITERKLAEAELLLNNKRLDAQLELNQMTSESMNEIYSFALENAVEITDSDIGFLGFVNDDCTIVTIYNWSGSAMEKCKVENYGFEFEVEKAGIWGKVVRTGKPLILNDYNAPNKLKKGIPIGHVELKNYLSIPVFSDNKIVAIVAVANKAFDYTDNDVKRLTLLLDGMWRFSQEQKSKKELKAH